MKLLKCKGCISQKGYIKGVEQSAARIKKERDVLHTEIAKLRGALSLLLKSEEAFGTQGNEVWDAAREVMQS